MTISRRSLLEGLLGAAAGLALLPVLGGRAGAALPREAEVVVVGAGAAGIAAARRIVAAGRKVIVVEAASEIGGAASPIPPVSQPLSTAARAGCTTPTATRWSGWRAAPALR